MIRKSKVKFIFLYQDNHDLFPTEMYQEQLFLLFEKKEKNIGNTEAK